MSMTNRRQKNHTQALLISLLLAALVGASAAESARAHHLLPDHTLQCSDNFPCPKAIQPRVHFWIEVFGSWRKDTAILHDPKRPERVYAVIKSGQGCHRAVRSIIKRNRERVKKSLILIAGKIESGQKISDGNERHLAALFPSKKPREIRAAANNIRCQSGVRDSFVEGLKRYHHYRIMIDDVLRENNLPAEIRYLPFVESSYNPAAYSKAGAAGMWQIMPKTARVLGLELNATLDERRDPEAATRAAARYLNNADRDLSKVAKEINPNITRAQINPFIITSYNYGVSGMKRAMRQVEPDFMAVLERHKSPRFQIAVKNFYASFLAARHVAINAEHFFGKLPVDPTYRYQTVLIEHPTSITRIKTVFGIDEAQLRPLNRALTRFVWRGWRLVPAGYRLHLPHKKDRWQAERVKLASLRPEKVIGGGDRYTVRRGDTACGIARAVKVNCSELIRANHLGKTALIIAGQKLVIPRKLMVVDSSGGARKSLGQSGVATTYRVRKGDTACAIAKRFGVDCRTLINHNRLGRTAKIYPGQTLSISGQVPASIQPSGLNADHLYIVRKGDSACRVAQRFAVNCAALQQLNQLNRTTIIHPGQKLKIPGLVVPQTSATAQLLAGLGELKPTATAEPYESDEARSDLSTAQTVDAPDAWLANVRTDLSTAQTDEARSDQSTAQTVDAWLANVRTDLSTAQTDEARFDLSTAQTVDARSDLSTAQTVDAWLVNLRTDGNDDASSVGSSDGNTDILRNLLDTLPDLGIRVSVDADASDEKPIYSVRVEADETLGHFADWLGIVGTARLRAMNHLRSGRSIAIDQRLILPVTDAQMVERFEQRRTDYHQVLSESLKEHYDLVGIANHTVQRGDSAWSLSEQLGFPVWLLYRLNPILRDAPLVPGQVVVLPKLKAKV